MENEFSKLTDSLINARSQRMIDKINEKADNLELQINDTEEELAKLRVCCNAKLTVEEVVAWLKSFCTGDLMDMDFRRRIIEVLVNSIYLYDDKVVIYYNVRDGKQVSYIDMLDETSDIFEDAESSDNMCNGSPKNSSYFCASCFFIVYTNKSLKQRTFNFLSLILFVMRPLIVRCNYEFKLTKM